MIWIIGGTSESRYLAQLLTQSGIPWLVTVTQNSARRLYEGLPGEVIVGRLTAIKGIRLLQKHQITGILDASHPFATEISHLAMNLSEESGIPYLRFERPDVALLNSEQVERIPNLEILLQPCYLLNQRVFLTIGIKFLFAFIPWISKADLWVRVLPQSQRLAMELGFPHERLILQRLPVDPDEEAQMWQTHRFTTVITKASGEAGGLPLKEALSQKLGVKLLVLQRPAMRYPHQTSMLTDVIQFCEGLQGSLVS